MTINFKKAFLSLAFVCLLSLSAWTYTTAEGSTISVCVSKTGAIYLFGEGFTVKKCEKSDQILTWNIAGQPGPRGDTGLQGPQGDIGPVGPQGLQGLKGDNALNGAGQIAFVATNPAGTYVLKTDGTIWSSNRCVGCGWSNNNGIPAIPIPVENIVSWQIYSLVDKDGNYWEYFVQWVNKGTPG